MLRALTDFLDEEIACVADCEINDDPFFPICGVCSKRILICPSLIFHESNVI